MKFRYFIVSLYKYTLFWHFRILKFILFLFLQQKKGPSGSVGDYRYIEGGFSCPECGKPFRNLHNLRRHASTMHGMNAAQLAEASDPARAEYNPTQARKPKVAPSR